MPQISAASFYSPYFFFIYAKNPSISAAASSGILPTVSQVGSFAWDIPSSALRKVTFSRFKSKSPKIYMAVLDPYRMEYVEHEIRLLVLRPEDVSSLLRALKKVQDPSHDLIARWKDPAQRERWGEHMRALYQTISQLQ